MSAVQCGVTAMMQRMAGQTPRLSGHQAAAVLQALRPPQCICASWLQRSVHACCHLFIAMLSDGPQPRQITVRRLPAILPLLTPDITSACQASSFTIPRLSCLKLHHPMHMQEVPSVLQSLERGAALVHTPPDVFLGLVDKSIPTACGLAGMPHDACQAPLIPSA